MRTLTHESVLDPADELSRSTPSEVPPGGRRPRRRIGLSVEPVVSLTILALLVTCALFANQIAAYDPLAPHLPERLQPPLLFGGGWHHPLGTDDLGRDI